MQAIFGGVIAVILLGLYLQLIRVASQIVSCQSRLACTDYPVSMFNDGMQQALALIGGLVSALVVAELAITKPGQMPAFGTIVNGGASAPNTILKFVSVFYLLAWISGGLWAFILGLYHPTVVPALTTLGQSWLGVAVAAAYAYFGLQRPS